MKKKIVPFLACLAATTAIAAHALQPAASFKANSVAIAFVIVLFAVGLMRYFQRENLTVLWKRSVKSGLVAVALVSLYLVALPRLLPPSNYENAHYIVDPSDYRYWIDKTAFLAAIPEFLAGVASMRAADFLTGERNRRQPSFVATTLMSCLFGLWCTVKVGLASIMFFLIWRGSSLIRAKAYLLSDT